MKRCIFLLLVFTALHLKADAQAMVSRAAGTGVYGFSGDGGPATAGQVRQTQGICMDGAGNIYIGDVGNARVRKIDTFGIITTVAGNGAVGFSGDGGPATNAKLSFYGVNCDPAGNLLIGDWNNKRVRRVDAVTGIITTVAGDGTTGSSGDGGPATAAQINRPICAIYDNAHNIIISEYGGCRIRRVDASTGIITTIAGTGVSGSAGDGGPATAATIGLPVQITLALGNIYIAFQSGRIRKIDGSGIISTVVGGGSGLGSGIPATAASLAGPEGVAADCHGNIYVADNDHNLVKMISPLGVLTILAGGGTTVPGTTGVPALSALFHNQLLCFDRTGNLYVTNDQAGSVWMISNVVSACPEDSSIIGGGTDTSSGPGTGGGTDTSSGPGTGGGGTGGGSDTIKIGPGTGDGSHYDNAGIYHTNGFSLAVHAEPSMPDMQIFPNPAHTVLQVRSPFRVRIIITASDGRVVADRSDTTDVSIGQLPPGLYIVTLYGTNGKMLKTEKMQKE